MADIVEWDRRKAGGEWMAWCASTPQEREQYEANP
jgi:hypothetical protein